MRRALVGGLVALVAMLAAANATSGTSSGYGAVEVCKAPGAAVAGKQYGFTVGGQHVSLTASATQTMCSQAVKVAAGTATVTEAAASGFKVTAVAAIPSAALVGSPDLDARRATVRVEAGEETLVVFTNAAVTSPPPPPPAPHTVKLCKTGDVDAKASFSFAVTRGGTAVQGSPFTLSTGACTLVGSFPVGTELTVVETPAPGTAVAGVTASPAAFLASADGATAHVRVVQTRSTVNVLTIENKRLGTSPGHGKNVPVKLCKAGKIPSGTSFSFAVSVDGAAVSGSPFTVAAGQCVLVGALPVGTVLSITEAPAPGTELAGVAAWPPRALLSVGDRTATVRVTASRLFAKHGKDWKKPSFHALVAHVLGKLAKKHVGSAKLWKGEKTWKAGKSWKGAKKGKHRALTSKRTSWKGWSRGDDAYRYKSWWKGATVVWFHNRGVKPTPPPPPPGKASPLKLCKAGDVDRKASFSFAVTREGSSVTGSPFSLTTGDCTLVGSFPVGSVLQVVETPAEGTALKAVYGSPSGVVVSVDGNAATVKVVNTGWNVVVFKNTPVKAPPRPAKTYPLKVCKAGKVDPKAAFAFAVSGSGVSGSFWLKTGECKLLGSFAQGTTLAISETPASGTVLKEVVGFPSGVVIGVQGTTATVKVAPPDEVNKVVFVNTWQKTPPPPPGTCTYTKGFYKSEQGAGLIDKVAAAGLALPATTTVDGGTTGTLTNAQVHAVFDTSQSELAPGTGDAFNLLQQTVAALLNVERGATASASVQAAIATALAGLSVELDGGVVTDVSATASALAALGTVEGFNANPATHCD